MISTTQAQIKGSMEDYDFVPSPAIENASPLYDQLCKNAAEIIASEQMTVPQKAHLITSYGLYFRQVHITQELVAQKGRAILAGPLKGQKLFPDGTVTGSCLPRLMGNYEYELHDWLETVATIPYQTIINVGSAEGYYSIGLARLIPTAKVYAAEILPNMQKLTMLAAQDNNVSDRITVIGEISPQNLNGLIRGRTLVFCDIEGGEDALLDPSLAPRLADADILVEIHEVFQEGLIEKLKARFADTHTYVQIEPGSGAPILPDITKTYADIDRALLTFEGRLGYTPWGWWQSKTALKA